MLTDHLMDRHSSLCKTHKCWLVFSIDSTCCISNAKIFIFKIVFYNSSMEFILTLSDKFTKFHKDLSRSESYPLGEKLHQIGTCSLYCYWPISRGILSKRIYQLVQDVACMTSDICCIATYPNPAFLYI